VTDYDPDDNPPTVPWDTTNVMTTVMVFEKLNEAFSGAGDTGLHD
jgi:hypothetical protein